MFARGRWLFGGVTEARVHALDQLEMVHLGLLAFAAVAVLFRRFRRGAGWEQHRQLQWIAYGVGGGYLPFLIVYCVPYLLHAHVPMLVESLAVVPLGLVPLTFAYAILRYKLWDIEVIVRDTISWTLTLLLGVIGFSLINLAVNRGLSEEMSLARNLLTFVSGLGLASLLVPARSAISSVLERFHYRDTFGKRRALSGFGRELLHERDLGRLCVALLDGIEEGVALERANLYLAQGDTLRRRPAGGGAAGPPAVRRPRPGALGARLAAALGGHPAGRAAVARHPAVRGRLSLRLPADRPRPRRRHRPHRLQAGPRAAQQRGFGAHPPPARPGGAGDRERPARRSAPGAAGGGPAAPALHRGDLRVVAGRHRGARRRAPAGLGQRRLRPARRPRARAS